VRADDLAALPIAELLKRNPGINFEQVDEATTINRLCASGLDAVGMAARGIKAGDYRLAIAGGVESMSRAPFVMPKATAAYSRANAVHDTTIGWRFVNPRMQSQYGTDSMPETADNVAKDYKISREDQDAFAARSQARYAQALAAGHFNDELMPVSVPQRKADPIVVDRDEHPRAGTTTEKLAGLRAINGPELSVTAGNASGVEQRRRLSCTHNW